MIFDSIQNIGRYKYLGDNIAEALEYLGALDNNRFTPGQRILKANELMANFDALETQPAQEMLAENHRTYIDIHFVVEGIEVIEFVCPLDQGPDQLPEQAYNVKDDYELYRIDGTAITMIPGYFALFFPGEIHKPGIGLPNQSLKKVIMKVKAVD